MQIFGTIDQARSVPSVIAVRPLALVAAAGVLAAMVLAHASLAEELGFLLPTAAALGLWALLWPALDYRLVSQPMERLIAFVGCDGSGKSTLTDDLHHAMRPALPVRVCYLGLGSGALGERIKRVPLLGAMLERRLARKAGQARSKGQKIPGLATALVIYGFSLLRLRRFRKMLRLRQHGYIVLTDRYPQTQFPGLYDGPGLSAATPGSWAVAQLARCERRLYEWMAAFRPDMVVRLNVDAATALARKPEHKADLIARKVRISPQLHFEGARIVDLDATRSYGRVRADAVRLVQGLVGRRARLA